MGDCDNSTFSKFFRDDSLDDSIILHVDICSCFINKDYFTLLEKSSTDTQKLFLACR